MKKLLTLMLVLCLASAASASLSLAPSGSITVAPDTTTTITISSDSSAQSGYNAYVIIETGGDGSLTNLIDLDDAGNLATGGVYTEEGWGDGYWMQTGSTQSDLFAGDHYTVDYDSTGLGYGDSALVSLWLDPDYDNSQDTLTITVIPEPMTIALLGLGGLLLRRRK